MKKEKICKIIHIKPGSIKQIKKTMNVINDINRLRILSLFKKYKELCVCDIFQALRLKQNLVSYHLRILRQTGLVISERKGSNVYYRKNKEKIVEIIGLMNKLIN